MYEAANPSSSPYPSLRRAGRRSLPSPPFILLATRYALRAPRSALRAPQREEGRKKDWKHNTLFCRNSFTK